jgi:hypothetical protein
MREPKCTLNLPIIIGQTPTVPNRESGSQRHRPHRRPNSPLPRRYGRKPGIAVFIGRHISNRSFRNDVNAGVIPFGERTAIKVSSSASKFGARWTNLIPLISPRVAIFCAAVAARCVDIAPVSQRAMRFLPQTVK